MEADRKTQSKVRIITPESIDEVWDQVAPLLKPAVDLHDGYYMRDVYNELRSGRQMLWVYAIGREIKAAIVVEVLQYPRKRSVMVVFAGGALMVEWLEYFETLKQYARAVGAKDIEVIGRCGWARVLKADQEKTYLKVNV